MGGFARGLQNVGTITKTIMVAIAGGTASVLGGGKFSNGAMSVAFVFMFNEMMVDRLKQLKALATKIAQNKNVDVKLRTRLKSVLRQNKLYYTDSTDGPKGWIKGVYRGYSRSGNRLYLTSALYDGDTLSEAQAVETIIHETIHKIWPSPSRNHPDGFWDLVYRNSNSYWE